MRKPLSEMTPDEVSALMDEAMTFQNALQTRLDLAVRHESLLKTIKSAIAAHDIEKESAQELRGLLGRIQRDVNSTV